MFFFPLFRFVRFLTPNSGFRYQNGLNFGVLSSFSLMELTASVGTFIAYFVNLSLFVPKALKPSQLPIPFLLFSSFAVFFLSCCGYRIRGLFCSIAPPPRYPSPALASSTEISSLNPTTPSLSLSLYSQFLLLSDTS